MIESLLFIAVMAIIAVISNGRDLLNYFIDWRKWWLGELEVVEPELDSIGVDAKNVLDSDLVEERAKRSDKLWMSSLDTNFFSDNWKDRPKISSA
jgi:hypothetical protein